MTKANKDETTQQKSSLHKTKKSGKNVIKKSSSLDNLQIPEIEMKENEAETEEVVSTNMRKVLDSFVNMTKIYNELYLEAIRLGKSINNSGNELNDVFFNNKPIQTTLEKIKKNKNVKYGVSRDEAKYMAEKLITCLEKE